jgi:Lipocalin-like domain
VVGTWQVTSFSILMLDTNEALQPFGEHPIGYVQYSPGGHMVIFISTGTPQRAAGTAYTDAERVDLYKAIIAGYAGTYSVEGNKVTHHIVASWFPEWIGRDHIRYAEIEGNRLTLKTTPLKSPLDGRDNVATVTFERVD